VCEQTLSADERRGGLVPRGELRFIHVANGSVAHFRKTSKAMYGCNGRHANSTDGCFGRGRVCH
jgi:hypothetical protein